MDNAERLTASGLLCVNHPDVKYEEMNLGKVENVEEVEEVGEEVEEVGMYP